jgi:polyisoprenoid-binding protein YceI
VTRYRIIPERSYVWVDARSSVHRFHAQANGLAGFVDLALSPEGVIDAASTAAGQLSLAVNRLSAGNPVEDRELQRRTDASRYPKIEGVLDQIVPSGDYGKYRVSGEITFRGVARRCDDEMTVAALDADTVQLTGKSRFDIRDFGMEPPRALMFRMEPEVEVRVEIVAAREL